MGEQGALGSEQEPAGAPVPAEPAALLPRALGHWLAWRSGLTARCRFPPAMDRGGARQPRRTRSALVSDDWNSKNTNTNAKTLLLVIKPAVGLAPVLLSSAA